MPVELGFDFRMAHFYGIGTYIRGLLDAAQRSSEPFHLTLIGSPPAARPYLRDARFSLLPCSLSPYTLKTHSFFRRLPFPLLHFPHYNASICTSRYLLTVHDCIPLLFPKALSQPLAYPYVFMWHYLSIRRAAHILAVSRKTAQDLCRLFALPQEKITITYEGVDPTLFFPDSSSPLPKQIPSQPYFLYVGSAKAHKNLPLLLNAFSEWVSRTSLPHSLLLLGTPAVPAPQRLSACGHAQAGGRQVAFSDCRAKTSPLPREALSLRSLSPATEKRVLVLPRVPRESLRHYYSRATALIVPSLYEGFGLPPLEAYACHCPVISSNSPALVEIQGGASLYFPRKSAHALYLAMKTIAEQPLLREKLIRRGAKRVRAYTWEKTFAQTFSVYRALLS